MSDNYTLTDEQMMVKDTVHRMAQEKIAPLAADIDESGEFPQEIIEQFKELGQQIGGLGRKFGGFTEGMAFPSMDRILRERFGMDVVGMRLKSQLNGKWMELDVMAYSTVTDDVYIVEVKSYLKEGAIEQMLKKMEQFSTFYPAQRGKKLYGILAAVDVDNEAVRQALSEGFYMARIINETFELVTPQDFEPRAFDC